jgi:hypothetical protein
MRVPQVGKAPDGFEPPQKAMPAFPFPLGYGAILDRLKELQTRKQQRVQNSEISVVIKSDLKPEQLLLG